MLWIREKKKKLRLNSSLSHKCLALMHTHPKSLSKDYFLHFEESFVVALFKRTPASSLLDFLKLEEGRGGRETGREREKDRNREKRFPYHKFSFMLLFSNLLCCLRANLLIPFFCCFCCVQLQGKQHSFFSLSSVLHKNPSSVQRTSILNLLSFVQLQKFAVMSNFPLHLADWTNSSALQYACVC